jgi:hypothetical protein
MTRQCGISISEPPSFDEVLATLADLERRINQTGNG